MSQDLGRGLAGLTILLVDDHQPSIKLIEASLAGEGCIIWSATTAEDALELLALEPPRLVLLDLALPGMDGIELSKAIKSRPECRDTLIVAITSRNGSETEQEVRNAGCAAYLRKPIDAPSLAEFLARLLTEQP